MAANLAGCSFFAPGKQTISIASEPPGAKVTVDGNYIGETPTEVRVKRNRSHAVLVAKEGYRPIKRETDTTLATVGIVDAIGAFIWLIPALGLLAPGAWEQDPSNVAVILQEDD